MLYTYFDCCFSGVVCYPDCIFSKARLQNIIPSAHYTRVKTFVLRGSLVLCLSATFGVWRIILSFSYRHPSFVTCFHSTVVSFCTQATPSEGFRREENTAGNCTICTLRLVRRDVSTYNIYLQRCWDCGKPVDADRCQLSLLSTTTTPPTP